MSWWQRKRLMSSNSKTRCEAALALGKQRDRHAIPLLVQTLAESSKDLQEAARMALNQIDPEWPKSIEAREAVPILVGKLDMMLGRSDLTGLRGVIMSLHMIGGKTAIQALIERFDRLPLKNIDSSVQIAIARNVLAHRVKDSLKRAIEIVSKARDAEAIESLAHLLSDQNPSIRYEASKALKEIRDDWWKTDAVQATISTHLTLLSNADSEKRAGAANALGNLRNPQATESLIPLLSDKDEKVRRATATALGQIGDVRAADSLVTVLKDTHDVSASACWALGQILPKISDPNRIHDLIEKIRKQGIRLDELRSALVGTGHRSAIPALIESMPYSEFRYLEALNKLNPNWDNCSEAKEAVPRLISMLSEPKLLPDVRAVAARLLGRLRDERVIKPLGSLMENIATSDEEREAATVALCWLGDHRGVTKCMSILEDPKSFPTIFALAAEALARIGKEDAIKTLIVTLSNKKTAESKRVEAAKALGRLQEPSAALALAKVLSENFPMLIRSAIESLTEVMRHSITLIPREILEELLVIFSEPIRAYIPSEFDWDRMEYDRDVKFEYSVKHLDDMIKQELNRRGCV